MKLSDRIQTYAHTYAYKLLPKLPIIVNLNGRGFNKLTSLLEKPFCKELDEAFYLTMLNVAQGAEGTVFGYKHNDEMTFILRNDQSQETKPWYDGDIQKINSVICSMATMQFNKCISSFDLSVSGDPLFITSVFCVPNLTEAANILIYKQQHALQASINQACFYNLLDNNYDKYQIKEMLQDLSVDEKRDLLQQRCGISFSDYPKAFRRGVATYRTLTETSGGYRNKWTLDADLPIFSQDHKFLGDLISA